MAESPAVGGLKEEADSKEKMKEKLQIAAPT
jgi:hypothetical protein